MKLCYRKFGILVICMLAICEGTPADNLNRKERQITMTSPIISDKTAPGATQQQGLPIIGALVPGLGGLGNIIPLGNLGQLLNLNGLFSGVTGIVPGLLGGLVPGLGGLVPGLGGLVPGLGGTTPGLGVSPTQQTQCPLGQVSRCRCENLLPVTGRSDDILEIVQQKVSLNLNGEKEIR